MGEGICVQSCSDGPRACCRIFSAVIAGILLFIGIVLQISAGSHVDDLPLTTLCEAYSGSPELLTKNDYEAMVDWYGVQSKCEERGTCNSRTYSYHNIANLFLRSTGYVERHDLLRFADLAFYCKHVPSYVNEAESCFDPCPDGSMECTRPFPCKLWGGQTRGSGESSWYMHGHSSIRHVSCLDKSHVFDEFLQAMFVDDVHKWSANDVEAARNEFYTTCLLDKGNTAYILNCGPIMAIVGGIITILTLFKRFHGPPWPEIGTNLLVLSLILILLGFWAISIGTVREIASYAICGSIGAPVVFEGMRYDGHPCVDRDTNGKETWNPFVFLLSLTYSSYIVGGVMTFVSVILFLGIITGFTAEMMGEKFGKYLVQLNDIPSHIQLPFPGGTNNLSNMMGGPPSNGTGPSRVEEASAPLPAVPAIPASSPAPAQAQAPASAPPAAAPAPPAAAAPAAPSAPAPAPVEPLVTPAQ